MTFLSGLIVGLLIGLIIGWISLYFQKITLRHYKTMCEIEKDHSSFLLKMIREWEKSYAALKAELQLEINELKNK